MTCTVKTLPHTYTAGDTLPDMVCVLEDTDLTDYTITLHLERPGTTVLDKAADIVDAAGGEFKIVWEAADLVAGSGQEATFEFVDGDDGIETVEGLRIDVVEAIS